MMAKTNMPYWNIHLLIVMTKETNINKCTVCQVVMSASEDTKAKKESGSVLFGLLGGQERLL